MHSNNIFSKIYSRWFTPMEVESPRNNNFNVIRLLAAVLVIYGHMAAIMGLPQFTAYNQVVSSIGVKILFVVSGFLITRSFLRDGNFLRYMVRRCFRIFPGLIGVVIFSAFIIGPIFTNLSVADYFKNPNTYAYLKNIIFFPVYILPGVFGNNVYPNAVNGSLWSLPVEFILYLILPLVFVIFKKLKILKPGIIGCTIICIIVDYIRIAHFLDYRFVFFGSNWPDGITLVTFFFMGSMFALPGMDKFFNFQIAAALFVAGSFISLNYAKSEVLLVLLLPYFILSFAYAPRPAFAKWFSNADFSYGLYLYGFVLEQALYSVLMKYSPSLNVMTVISFAATFLFAVASWYIIEKPFQNLSKKLVKRLQSKKQ